MVDFISLINNNINNIIIVIITVVIIVVITVVINNKNKLIVLDKPVIKNTLSKSLKKSIEKYTTNTLISDIINSNEKDSDEISNNKLVLFYTEKEWNGINNNNYIEDLTNNKYYIIDKEYYYLLDNNTKLIVSNDNLKIKCFNFEKYSKKIIIK